jgi:hypothetical protein
VVNKYVLDRESAKKHLGIRKRNELVRGLHIVALILLYIFFSKQDLYEERPILVLWALIAMYAVWAGVELLISHFLQKELTDCAYYIRDKTLIHELKNGKKVFVDLNDLDLKNSDIERGQIVSLIRKIKIPEELPGKEQLLKEIREVVLLPDDETSESKDKGPLTKTGRYAMRIFLFIALTILTQTGGLIYLLSTYISHRLSLSRLRSGSLFAALYFIFTLLITPLLAPLFGRSPLPTYGKLRPLNYITVLFNRHYVKTDLKNQLVAASEQLSADFRNTSIKYLDANFPFINGFPLLPHLSHDDGKKVDLAFFYEERQTGEATETVPSIIGYGVYEAPMENEVDYPGKCKNEGHWLYGIIGTWVPRWRAKDYTVDEERTVALLKILLGGEHTSKVFIEPHLKQRWRLQDYDKIRFQGCSAVRHDDHIHLQVK